MFASSAPITNGHWPWTGFWDALDSRESSWARQLPDDGRNAFEQLVESMIRASIIRERMDALRASWAALRLKRTTFKDGDLLWNVTCKFDDPNRAPDQEIEDILEDFRIWCDSSSDSEDDAPDWDVVKQHLPQFIKELSYCALCTIWTFVRGFANYTATLPSEVLEELREDMFRYVVTELLMQLA